MVDYLVGGWALPLRKNDGASNSWDDDIPNMEKWKMFQTTNQKLMNLEFHLDTYPG